MAKRTRTINKIIAAEKINMGGHLIDQPLPAEGIAYIDPFLLIHHWEDRMKGGQRQQEVGVGPHPHRGFSPVTFIYEGNIQHRDSLGNNAIVHEGGTQWMHAGRGIIHSERPSKALAENGGALEFIQFWVNTPAKFKMSPPGYLPISKEDTPITTENGVETAVVAGEYKGLSGPAKTFSPQILMRITGPANRTVNLDLPQNHNVIIYQLSGKLLIQNQTIESKNLVWFNKEEGNMEIKIEATTRFIVLSGEPINEPVSTYGPFVMNTQSEIIQALHEAQMGKMGVLIETFSDE